MSLTKQFKTNPEKEQAGVPVTFGSNEDGTVPTFYLARQSNRNMKYVRAVERETKPYRRQMEMGTLANDKADEINKSIFVSTVLLGWQNIKASDVDGDNSKTGFADFTKDNALALMNRLPDLYDQLQLNSKDATLFRDEELEADSKN